MRAPRRTSMRTSARAAPRRRGGRPSGTGQRSAALRAAGTSGRRRSAPGARAAARPSRAREHEREARAARSRRAPPASTSLPDASPSARHRSAATALPSRWRACSARTPSRKTLGAEVVLDHAHHRRALLVRDDVEVLGRLGDAPHRARRSDACWRARRARARRRDRARSPATSATPGFQSSTTR